MKRLFTDDGEWNDTGLRLHRVLERKINKIVAEFEDDEEDLLDLRDVHYVISSAAGSFVSILSTARKLSK